MFSIFKIQFVLLSCFALTLCSCTSYENRTCWSCDGSGTCFLCHGTGYVHERSCRKCGFGSSTESEYALSVAGDGQCQECGGDGKILTEVDGMETFLTALFTGLGNVSY